MNIAFFIVLLTLTNKQVLADTPSLCSASVTTAPKSSWNSNGVYYQMYDILVRNTGYCTITSLSVSIAHPTGTNIVSPVYNYDISTGEISGFGGSIAPGQSFNGSGFTISASSASLSQSALTVSVSQQACSNCPTQAPAHDPIETAPIEINPVSPTVVTAAPATKAPTQAPATKAPTKAPTKGPTKAPTRGPTVAPTAVPTINPAENCYGRCIDEEVCVDMSDFYGPQCYPRNCGSIYCGSGEVCIGDGGVARCIVTDASEAEPTPSPTPFPASDPCNGMCTQGEVCVTLNQTEGYMCYLQSCAGMYCNEGYTCMSNGGVAQCIHTGSGRREKPMKLPIDTSASASSSVPSKLPPAVVSPVSVPPSSGSAPASVCGVSVTAVPRARSSYMQDNGLIAQIWDLIISNDNTATPSQIELDISVPSGNFVSQTWNLVRSGGQGSSRYAVTTHNIFAHNTKFYSAGFVVSGSATPSVSVSDVKCRSQ